MVPINRFLFLILLLLTTSHANPPLVEKKKLPLAQSLPLLQTITKHAISIGSGKTDVYVFVDPKCPRSREFITLISNNKKMQSLYHYKIFLYELKRFRTKEIIRSIYSSHNPKKTMLDFMTVKKVPTIKRSHPNKKIDAKIHAINKIAQKIDVYKRPYLVLVKKRKP